MSLEMIKASLSASSARQGLLEYLESECRDKLDSSLQEVVQVYRYGCMQYTFYGKEFSIIKSLLFIFPLSDEIFSRTVDPKEIIICSGNCNPTSLMAYYGHNPKERKQASKNFRKRRVGKGN
jgi:hypothetical protein